MYVGLYLPKGLLLQVRRQGSWRPGRAPHLCQAGCAPALDGMHPHAAHGMPIMQHAAQHTYPRSRHTVARPLHTVQCLAVTSTGASTALRGGRLPLLEPLLQQGHATAPLDLAATGNPSPKLHARVHSWSHASGSTCTSCKLLQANQQFPLYGTTALANPPIPKSWSLPPPPNTHTLTGHGHRREQQRWW